MTNILRDVGEDYQNERLYFPRQELVLYGIRESDIAEGCNSTKKPGQA
jgi:phytoene/squalene synthetase